MLVLAGQREGVVDPLCAQAGIEWKALLPIHGKPMIDYVLAALAACPALAKPVWISGMDTALIAKGLKQSPSEAGPASSVVAAAQAGLPTPFLVTTCDHPLLSPKMIEDFIEGAQASGADFALGLASKDIIQPAYPHVKRTYLKFRDDSVSGCNLFYVKNQRGLRAIEFWRAAQNDRKKPIKLARRLGFGMLIRYITGRLSVQGAFQHAADKLGITACPVMLNSPEAAIDVDKPSDLELVESILCAKT